MFPRQPGKHVLGLIRQASGGTRQRQSLRTEQSALSGPVDVTTVTDVNHRDDSSLVVNPVDDPVGAPPCAEPIAQRWKQPLADTVWLFQQRAGDEVICGCRNSLWQRFSKCPADRGRSPQRVGLLRTLAHSPGERRRIVSASSAADTDSPLASSASDSDSRVIVSLSRRMASVSSSRSRSSTATSTADGRPCTVTVTRSWWSCTRTTSSERWVLTSPRGRVVIVKSMTKIRRSINTRVGTARSPEEAAAHADRAWR
jgi:hypothetical protein